MIRFLRTLDADALIREVRLIALDCPVQSFPAVKGRKKAIGRIAYIPIEVAARDMPHRLWIAGELAKRGWEVIAGAAWNLQAVQYSDLPPGLILLKTLNYLDAIVAAKATESGHAIACLHEELFAIEPTPQNYAAHCHPATVPLVDLICAQGKPQARAFDALGYRGSITGNPRAGDPLQCRLGPYEILVCLQTGNTNGIMPFGHYMRATMNVMGGSRKPVVDAMIAQIEHEVACHALLIEAANDLAAVPEVRLRLRPHPVEDATAYEVDGNCILDDRSPLRRRLTGCQLLIHAAGCGTAVDAELAGVHHEAVGEGGFGIVGPARDHFAPVNLPDVLSKWQADHHAPQDTTALFAYCCRHYVWQPNDFQRGKFADVSLAEVVAMSGFAKVAKIGWNLWHLDGAAKSDNQWVARVKFAPLPKVGALNEAHHKVA